ncbi:MAG: hypothetical protein K5930_12770 [Treponemataceae bacterium]|nr:hypothetical protein [Treponemataceae bacterium]
MIIILTLAGNSFLFPYAITYKEQYYNLFHTHYQQYPEDVMENIYWLQRAVAADFCNPQYALAKIKDETQWEKYRYLFMMHVNIKLAEQHLRLGRTWDKYNIYFYDEPWKEEYLRNLDTAEACYSTGLYYWNEAKAWAEKANSKEFLFLYITDQQFWEDERERIYTGDLDYEKTINRELSRIKEAKDTLNSMDGGY